MTKNLTALKAFYTALGGSSDTAATLTSEIAVWNAILALGGIEGQDIYPRRYRGSSGELHEH